MDKLNPIRLTAIALAVIATGCASTSGTGPLVQLAYTPIPAAVDSEFPPNAKPGECYARVYVPRVYKTEQEQMLKRTASQQVDIIPAKYEEVQESVLVSQATTRTGSRARRV